MASVEGRAVRGYHDACKSYDLKAHQNGRVYCATCGAEDLLPHREAINEANGSLVRLDRWTRRFAREVREGRRSPVRILPSEEPGNGC